MDLLHRLARTLSTGLASGVEGRPTTNRSMRASRTTSVCACRGTDESGSDTAFERQRLLIREASYLRKFVGLPPVRADAKGKGEGGPK
jgi:hypothetical protein